ncbi:MAG: hypothetical protein AAGE65_00025 [Planctomycetota bacterium]
MTGFPNPDDPYGQPSAFEAPRPRVVLWFKVYLFVSIAFGALMALSGLAALSDPAAALDSMRQSGQVPPGSTLTLDDMRMLGWVYGIAGLIGVALPIAWFLVPRGNVKWILGIVLIALGMPGLVTLVVLVPLLIFWVREDCKAWCQGQAAAEARRREPWA